MVGVNGQPFVSPVPFPFVLVFAMYDLLSFKSDFCRPDRRRGGFCGYPAGASIKRSLPAPMGHWALRVLRDRRQPVWRERFVAVAEPLRCEAGRILRPK